jgi:peptidoglycan-associated lipoprotein
MMLSLMLVVSCGKKEVQTDPALDAAAEETVTDAVEEPADAAVDTATEEAMAQAQAAEEAARKEAEALAQAVNDFISVDVYFDYDSSVIVDSEISILESKADWLLANIDANIIIEGHCDERGTTEYNLALGDRRAERAKSFLVNLGVDPARITTISYGEERPVAMGHNETSWAKNRRAHFLIK